MTLSSGSLVSQGEETPDEYARPRPIEKYWEDYEDWKVRALNPNRVPPLFLLPNPRPPRPLRDKPVETINPRQTNVYLVYAAPIKPL